MTNRTRAAAMIALAATLAAGGCGGSGSTAHDMGAAAAAGATSTVPAASAAAPAGAFNDADVTFAQSMIPHHEQAIEMADIALDPAVNAGAAIRTVAARVKAAQDPEIKQMTALLASWNKPVAMDTSGGHDMGSMTGMMSADDMQRLGAATGATHDKLWATLMITHHQGAIDMAKTVKASGKNPDIAKLADAIISGQQAEITELTPLAG